MSLVEYFSGQRSEPETLYRIVMAWNDDALFTSEKRYPYLASREYFESQKQHMGFDKLPADYEFKGMMYVMNGDTPIFYRQVQNFKNLQDFWMMKNRRG